MKEYKSAMPEIELKFKRGEVLKSKICSSIDSHKLLMKFYNQDTIELTETVIVIYLNRANNTIGWQKHSSGGMCSSIIDVRLIIATALKCGSTGLIVSHNHPSGGITPSDSDRQTTKKLKEAGKLFDISLLDHVIVNSENQYYSFADEGEI